MARPCRLLAVTVLVLADLLGVTAADATAPFTLFEGEAKTARPKVGTNLGVIAPEGAYCPWVNLMRCSAEFSFYHTRGWPEKQSEVPLRPTDGYPAGLKTTQLAKSNVLGQLAGHYRGGEYTLTFAGNGTVSVAGDATRTSTSTGRMTFHVTPANAGIELVINASSATDPVRDIVLVPSAFVANHTTAPFDPAYLALARTFNTLGTVFWQRERYNGYTSTKVLNWVNRSSTSHYTYATDNGVPHEEIVAFVNAALTNVWITIPQFSCDDYVTQLAQYYRSNLHSAAVLYVQDTHNRGWMADPRPRMAQFKRYKTAFVAAFGPTSTRYEIILNCEVCDEYLQYLEPTHTQYDAAFHNAVDHFAMNGVAWMAKQMEVWGNNGTDPFLTDEIAPIINDTYRIMQEAIYRDEVKYVEKVNQFALLNMSLYAYGAEPSLALQHYGHRFNHKNSSAAALEATLEENFWNFERGNSAQLGDLTAEWLERWYRFGGGLFMTAQMLFPGRECIFAEPGIHGMSRDHCNFPALVRYIDEVDSSQKLAAVKDFIANGTRGSQLLINTGVPAPKNCSVTCVWGTCTNGACLCDHGYKGDACDTFDETLLPNRCSPDDYGMNLAGASDWSPQWVWSNWMMYAREWIHQPITERSTDTLDGMWQYNKPGVNTPMNWANMKEFPDVDQDGYPTYLGPNDAVSTFLRRDTYAYPHGIFHVFYDGEGTLKFRFDTHVVRRVRPGYIIVKTVPVKNLNNGLYFQIIRTNPDNHLRRIRVIHDDQLATWQGDAFHPMYIRHLQEYKFLRYMSVQNVGGPGTCLNHLNCNTANNTEVNRTWSQRTNTTYYSQISNFDGWSLEYVIALANRLHINPWLSTPYNADDDYIRHQAEFVKKHLNPKLKPIIEYSNEVWATHHYVGFYAQDMGVKYFPQTRNDGTAARACWNQKRSREVWRIYNEVGLNVTRVLGGQSAWLRPMEAALECDPTAAAEIDSLSVAPYFGFDLAGDDGILTLDEVFERVPAALNNTKRWVAGHKALADRYNISGVSLYEAGPAFFGGALASDPDVVELGRRIHSDPRVKDLVKQYFDAMKDAGSTLQGYFVGTASGWGRYGAWGIRQAENEDPKVSYKLQGYRAWAAETSGSPTASGSSSCAPGAGVTTTTACPNNCSGHGECMNDGTCYCYLTYNGTDCSGRTYVPSIEECNKYTCEPKNGTCQPTSIDGMFKVYTCVGCSSGWGGWDCQRPMCDSNCSWAGKCTAPNTCTCYRGFTGPRCEIDCGCNGHGTCGAGNQCVCDTDYRLTGTGCEPTCDGPTCLAPGIRGCTEECVFGSCWNGTCLCWSGFTGPTCEVKAPSTTKNRFSSMGINVAGVADWTASTPFLNLMFRTRDWFLNPAGIDEPSRRWTTNEELTLTRDGYPAFLPRDRVAGTFATRDTFDDDGNSYIPAGRYVLLYDGDGRLEVSFDAKAVESSRSKGYMLVDYAPRQRLNNGFYIRIEATDPANPIRNIRIYSPSHPYEAYARTFVFTPEFMAELAPFRAIRFMNWLHTGGEYPTGYNRSWVDRKLPNDASMATGHGVAIEHMISLCNWLNADPWFSIPHDATDDYIEKFAEFVKRKLRPDVAIHIEHSNEVWNSHFRSHQYAVRAGMTQWPDRSPSDRANLWHGQRSQRIFSIFERVFGPLQFNRLKFKLGAFLMIPSGTRLALSQVTMRPLALAVVTYFCHEGTMGGEAVAQTLSTQELVQRCRAAASLNSTFKPLQDNIDLAREEGLTVESYEGGPSLVDQDVLSGGYSRLEVTNRYRAVHTDPAMAEIVQLYFTKHRQMGVDLEMYFTSSSRSGIYGSWGIKEATSTPCESAAKCRGTAAWVAANPNMTARMITWGMTEYGISNAIKVQFASAPTRTQLQTATAQVEASANLAPGTLTAVFDTRNTTASASTSRRAMSVQSTSNSTASTPSETVFFVVTASQNTNSTTINTEIQAAATALQTATLSVAVTSEEVHTVAADDRIKPQNPLPAALLEGSESVPTPAPLGPEATPAPPTTTAVPSTMAPPTTTTTTGSVPATSTPETTASTTSAVGTQAPVATTTPAPQASTTTTGSPSTTPSTASPADPATTSSSPSTTTAHVGTASPSTTTTATTANPTVGATTTTAATNTATPTTSSPVVQTSVPPAPPVPPTTTNQATTTTTTAAPSTAVPTDVGATAQAGAAAADSSEKTVIGLSVSGVVLAAIVVVGVAYAVFRSTSSSEDKDQKSEEEEEAARLENVMAHPSDLEGPLLTLPSPSPARGHTFRHGSRPTDEML